MYAIKVAKNVDPDIIAKLESVPNKSGYIKQLIRNDIASTYPIENEDSCGMTDYQFKIFLKLFKLRLEKVSKEQFIEELEDMIREL